MSTARQPFPDLVRACALFGIAVVNVDYIAHATMGGVIANAWVTPADRLVWWTVATLFLIKSYPLFALMFGAGIAQQMQSAAADGRGFAGRHWRRMVGLLLLGLVNAAFLYSGDILTTYAALGAVVFLFRGMSAKWLRRCAFALYTLQIVVMVWIASEFWRLAEEGGAELGRRVAGYESLTARLVAGFASTDPLSVAATRFGDWSSVFVETMMFSGAGLLAFILYGLYAVRAGLFEDLGAAHWSRARRVHLPLGLLLAGAGGVLMLRAAHGLDVEVQFGFLLLTIGSPLSVSGYLGLIAAWMQRPESRLRAFLVRAGGGSLTAYLLQGLLMSLVFCGYGIGLVGKLGAAADIAIAVAVALATLLFVGVWRARHALGPVEYLLRRWVYLGERRG